MGAMERLRPLLGAMRTREVAELRKLDDALLRPLLGAMRTTAQELASYPRM
jgi:hypothetical protein